MSLSPRPQGTRDPAFEGIVPRAAKRIFEYIATKSADGEVYTVGASFLEIYSRDGKKEELIDLLSDLRGMVGEETSEIRIRENTAESSFYIDGISQWPISMPEDLVTILKNGQKKQHTLETTMNACSSRSHSLFIITVECKGAAELKARQGKLLLVDLAGSESLKKVQAKSDANEELRQVP